MSVKRIAVLPDPQVKPGVNTDHMYWAGLYLAKMRPDVIVHLGDHWDMPSLCSYDKGKGSFEGRRVKEDINAGLVALQQLEAGMDTANEGRKYKLWKPRKIFLIGNHEQRMERALDCQPELQGLFSYEDFQLDSYGWEVHDFLKVVVVEGIAFSHYFTSGVMGRPVTNARLMLAKKGMSCIQGHVQDRDIAYAKRADGTRMTGLFAGTFYSHSEGYLGQQGNDQWRGLWILHDVHEGEFEEMAVSLDYLRRKYSVLSDQT